MRILGEANGEAKAVCNGGGVLKVLINNRITFALASLAHVPLLLTPGATSFPRGRRKRFPASPLESMSV